MISNEPQAQLDKHLNEDDPNWIQPDSSKPIVHKGKLQANSPYANIELANTAAGSKDLTDKNTMSLPPKFELLMQQPNVVEIFNLSKGKICLRFMMGLICYDDTEFSLKGREEKVVALKNVSLNDDSEYSAIKR